MAKSNLSTLKSTIVELKNTLVELSVETYNLILAAVIGALFSTAALDGNFDRLLLVVSFILVFGFLLSRESIKIFHSKYHKPDTSERLDDIESKLDYVIGEEIHEIEKDQNEVTDELYLKTQCRNCGKFSDRKCPHCGSGNLIRRGY